MKSLVYQSILFTGVAFIFLSCSQENQTTTSEPFYFGGDLSYINEMLDCGAQFRADGVVVDPYKILAEKGSNIARVRLWNNPTWTNYSNYQDVEMTIKKSKEQGMTVLLDFHYSDTWADPQHQVIPKAWENITDLSILGDSLYNYTYSTLSALHNKGLAPEFVQVGNEVNIEIMQDSANMITDTINWERNIHLLNKGLRAVNDFSNEKGLRIETMMHIAQPENALWWFDEATKYGLSQFDIIGMSYYPKWSTFGLDSLEIAIDSLKRRFKTDIMIVETAYPYTLTNHDEGPNILGEDALIPGYPATPKGQKDFVQKLIKITKRAGGNGVIYWEPAWVSTECRTLWHKGSGWDNATFFDGGNGNEVLPVAEVVLGR